MGARDQQVPLAYEQRWRTAWQTIANGGSISAAIMAGAAAIYVEQAAILRAELFESLTQDAGRETPDDAVEKAIEIFDNVLSFVRKVDPCDLDAGKFRSEVLAVKENLDSAVNLARKEWHRLRDQTSIERYAPMFSSYEQAMQWKMSATTMRARDAAAAGWGLDTPSDRYR